MSRRTQRLLGVVATLGALYACLCAGLSLRHRHVPFTDAELAAPLVLPGELVFWGTATSAHQIEGGNRNDWSRFEEAPGHVARGERSGAAADSWNRVAEDVALMRALGANAYRFSIEWSRVEPEESKWDEAAWNHYALEADQLQRSGITPMATLLHFTLPVWLADRGGVTAPDFPDRFARFAAEAARRLGGVRLWCTINEPNVQMYQGYVRGAWPPAQRSPELAVAAFANLLRAHAKAAAELHRRDPRAQVGVAVNLIVFEPASRAWLPDWAAAAIAERAFDWPFYDAIAAGRIRFESVGFPRLDEPLPGLLGSADFFGMNYYTRQRLRFDPSASALVSVAPPTGERSDLGWEIHPEGLLALLRQAWARYRLPIIVTENGIADAAGNKRGAFIRSHAYAIARAAREGVVVKGYFHWSLLDNFEWAEGFAPRFGLYHVDYATQLRSPAGGADVFKQLAGPR